jgi:hypothetical protein
VLALKKGWPTKNSSRPCGIRRYRATIDFRAACRLNSTLGTNESDRANFAVFAVALLASSVLAGWLHYFWYALLINDRTFKVYLELISAGTLMNWFFYFIYFFAIGFLLSLTLVT